MKTPDPSTAARYRAAILRARRVHEWVLANVEAPSHPRGWDDSIELLDLWDAYDRSVRIAAQRYAPMRIMSNLAYWRTLARMFRLEVLESEYMTYVEPAELVRKHRQVKRLTKGIRHG